MNEIKKNGNGNGVGRLGPGFCYVLFSLADASFQRSF